MTEIPRSSLPSGPLTVGPSILHIELKALLAKWLAESTKEIEILVKLREAAKIIKNDKLQSEIEWREQRCLRQQDCYQDVSRLLRSLESVKIEASVNTSGNKSPWVSLLQSSDEVLKCLKCESDDFTITVFRGLKCRKCGTTPATRAKPHIMTVDLP